MPKEQRFTVTGQIDEDTKLAPQAKVIHGCIKTAQGRKKFATRKDVLDVVNAAAADGTLETKQDPARILGYYQERLVDKGLIGVETVEIEAPKKESKSKNEAGAEAEAATAEA